MAVGVALTGQGSTHYNGKMTPFVVLSCMMAAMGGVIFGYDIGISGLNDIRYLTIPSFIYNNVCGFWI